jgi:hypothetical protein
MGLCTKGRIGKRKSIKKKRRRGQASSESSKGNIRSETVVILVTPTISAKKKGLQDGRTRFNMIIARIQVDTRLRTTDRMIYSRKLITY